MNGQNVAFSTDPFGYAQQRAISAMSMSVSNEQALRPGPLKAVFDYVFTSDFEYEATNHVLGEKSAILANVDSRKRAKFDLEPSRYPNMVLFRATNAKKGAVPTGLGAEALLRAFWCPYIQIGAQGNTLQGVPWIDLPRNLPARSFAFTGAMNGCSIVITDRGGGTIRMYHDSTHQMALFANENVITSLGYDAASGCAHSYANAGPPTKLRTSFNFLYYDANNWWLVSQPQVIEGGAPMRVSFNPSIAPFQIQI